MRQFLKSPIGDDPVVSVAHIAASPKQVFAAWTEPEQIKSWFGHRPHSVEHAEIDLRIGGAWRCVFDVKEETYNAVGGTYLAIEDGAKLSFTWRHEKAGLDGVPVMSPLSEVDVMIEADAMGSVLTVTHRSLASRQARMDVSGGWGPALSSLVDKFANSQLSEPSS